VGTPSGLSAVCTAIDAVPVLINLRKAFCSLLSICKMAMNLNRNGSACALPNGKIELLPFTSTVSARTNNVASGWIDTSGLIPIHDKDIGLPAGHALPSLVNCPKILGRVGCLNPKIRPHGYDLIDEPPDLLVSVRLVIRTGRAGLRKRGGFAGADLLQ